MRSGGRVAGTDAVLARAQGLTALAAPASARQEGHSTTPEVRQHIGELNRHALQDAVDRHVTLSVAGAMYDVSKVR